MSANEKNLIGVDVNYNTKSLNSLTDLVIVDIVRGAGFSSNLIDVKVDFDLIQADLDYFVKAFRETYKIDEKIVSTIYASYEMIVPASVYASKSKTPVNLIL